VTSPKVTGEALHAAGWQEQRGQKKTRRGVDKARKSEAGQQEPIRDEENPLSGEFS